MTRSVGGRLAHLSPRSRNASAAARSGRRLNAMPRRAYSASLTARTVSGAGKARSRFPSRVTLTESCAEPLIHETGLVARMTCRMIAVARAFHRSGCATERPVPARTALSATVRDAFAKVYGSWTSTMSPAVLSGAERQSGSGTFAARRSCGRRGPGVGPARISVNRYGPPRLRASRSQTAHRAALQQDVTEHLLRWAARCSYEGDDALLLSRTFFLSVLYSSSNRWIGQAQLR